MRKLIALLSLFALLPAARAVTAPPGDLGQGLRYLRVHSLAEPLAAVAEPKALVLDLRYATADAAGVAALRSALAAHPATAPLFILVSPATPDGVAGAIPAGRNVFTLGIVTSRPEPKVIVKFDAAGDRKAYDAVESGTPLDTLISGKVEKDRFDEAELVKEFKAGNPDAEPPPGPDPTAPQDPDAKPTPPPLVDRVLQRAVHLHRGLLALRRAS